MDRETRQRRAAMVEADRRRRADYLRKEKRRRIAWLVAVWLFAVPNLFLAWFFLRWFVALVMFAGLVWASWDYYRRGGMIDAIETTQRAGVYVPDAFRRRAKRR